MAKIEQLEFTCPVCGSHHFGTHWVSTPGMTPEQSDQSFKMTAEGYCHGEGCHFKWARRDDALCFRGTGVYREQTVTGTGVFRRRER